MLNAHKDQYLTDLSVGLFPEGFAGEVLAPTLKVNKDRDSWIVFERDHLRLVQTAVGDSAPAPIFDFVNTEDSYNCVRNAAKALTTKREMRRADDPLEPRAAKTKMLTAQILLWREYQVASLATTYGNYATGMYETVGTQWDSEGGTGAPIKRVNEAKKAILAQLAGLPDVGAADFVGVCNDDVWFELANHPDILDRIKYSGSPTAPAVASLEAVAQVLGLKRIAVASVRYNTKAAGQTPSVSSLWGKHMVIAYVPPRPGLYSAAAFYTFTYEAQVREAENVDPEGTWTLVERSVDVQPILVDTVASGKVAGAYLLRNAVA